MTVDKCIYCDIDFTGAVKKDSFSSASFMFPDCCGERRTKCQVEEGSGAATLSSGEWRLLSEPRLRQSECVSCQCLSVDLTMLTSVC